MMTRQDVWSRRSSKNRLPRSPDADLDFAGTRAPWMPPCSLWRSPLPAVRDGCVRTKGQVAAPSLQARAKCSTAYWYEPNALAKRANPRLEQCTAEHIRGNAFSLKTSLPSVNLAGLLPECNSHRRTRIAFCIEEFFGGGNGLTAGNTTLAVLHGRGGPPLRRSRQRRQQRPAYIDQFHPILKHTVDAAVEPMFWFCWFAPRCTCRDSDEPHSSPCALRLSASTSHPAWRAARGHGHCIDGERRGR